MADREGQRLDNYRLIRKLGAGSFGEVYLAENVYRKTKVAIKVLPQLTDDEMPGFLNEARTIRLKHPHIVQVLDFGLHKHTPFIVMEYIPNGNLRQRYPRGTRLPLDVIVSYVKQIADALQYAHDEKLIHRDVKPENILLGPDDTVLLSDFGIATVAHSSGSQLTQEMAGTVVYMAPEQLQGRPSVASDQYALAVIVYEWLCGARPFSGGILEIASQQMLASPPLLHEKVPTIHPLIEQVVMKALAKEPHKRFASVRAFAQALERAYQASLPVAAPPPPPQPQPAISPSPVFTPPSTPVMPPLDPRSLNTGRSIEVSLPSANKQSVSSDSIAYSPPVTALQPPKRKPLNLPMLALLALLVVALVSGGTYFVFRAGTGANVDQTIQNAQRLITQAKGEVATNPALALQDLARAQNLLHDAQNNSPTDSQRTRINNLLNGDLTQTVKNAITRYNQLALITPLPCPNSPPSAINDGSTNTHAQAIALLYDSKGNTWRYAVGQDHKLYQINDQNSLINILADLPTGTQVLSIAGGGQRLFVLYAFSTTPNGPVSYSLGQVPAGQTKFNKNVSLPSTVTQGGQTPKFLTASDSDVYVVLTSPATMTTNTVQVLDFNGSDLSSSTKNPRNISLSSRIVSVAASPDHELFFLLDDGSVGSLPLAGSSPAALTPVLIEHPISPTLAVSDRDFTAKMPVPTVTPIVQSTNGNVQLSIPGASMLAASMVDTMPHLYIVDVQWRRIVDLKVAQTTIVSTPEPATNPTPGKTSSTPTVSGGGVVSVTPTSFQVAQQYQSSSLFAQVKSVAVDPKGIDVLIQNTSSSFSLLSINTSSQNVCA